MGVIRAEPARMTDWAARSIGAAWRAFDLQLAPVAAVRQPGPAHGRVAGIAFALADHEPVHGRIDVVTRRVGEGDASINMRPKGAVLNGQTDNVMLTL